MGAKQSKRSVDISGKEAEGAGEVVAAGGEGRVEPLADADTLKPQLNGDAAHTPHTPHTPHSPDTPLIQPPVEISEKEKQLENGTPENEKDATTEKETVVTNGSGGDEESKPEQENGDAKPTGEAENNKKNKKEKVKKKWSLRSISFSRKEKPKQEKKQKDEEPKANGETDKLPEEGVDTSAIAESKISCEEVKDVTAVQEAKDGKTPETPVTEPITNGSSAPETPKEEAPAKAEGPALRPEAEKPVEEIKATDEPEKLPLNGLKLEDVKEEVAEVKTVEPAKEIPVPAPEAPAQVSDISVTTEVCVGQSPLKEPTPPPLPANPPPSSVTAFAETTMAPHLVDASVVETAGESVKPPSTASAEVTPTIETIPLDSNVDSQVHISLPLKDSQPNDEPQNNFDLTSQALTNAPETIEDSAVQLPVKEEITQQKVELKPLETSLAHVEVEKAAVPEIVEENSTITAKESDASGNPSEQGDIVADVLPETESIGEPKVVAEVTIVSSDIQQNINEDAKESNEKVLVADVAPLAPLVLELAEESKTSVEIIKNDIVQCSSLVTNGNFDTIRKDDILIMSLIDENVESSQEIISEVSAPLRPDSLPAELSSTAEELIPKSEPAQSPSSPADSMAASLSEVLPPPSPQEAAQENNEEVSESFPLPPSELCAGESEASGAASPELPAEPSQEVAAPVVEKSAEIVAPEMIKEKANIDDIVEAPASGATETAQAGSGDATAASD